MDHIECLQNRLSRGIIAIFGVIPYKYKSMGISPRILPVSYGESINFSKRFLREKVYAHLGCSLRDKGLVIIDLDLVSCFTSILLGLFPEELSLVRKAVDHGLWKYLEEEFHRNGKGGDLFKKGPVKICVYSSFFGGGTKAMTTGIMEGFREGLGIRPSEFKKYPDYLKMEKLANDVTYQMQQSSVISVFREVSKLMQDMHLDKLLVGPTGHKSRVSAEYFRSNYSNYLQSFEFALLAQGTINTLVH
uniref:Uncharacterized protein n=1 Tax=Anthoceros angustus TaxID=48387 RepID=A0A2P1L4U3_ANTAG|nr:hypothetical protein AnanMp22 [Anthoceros angustus]AVP12834.1 hypothetical protein AnanMp22 [Anthoceros angustus]